MQRSDIILAAFFLFSPGSFTQAQDESNPVDFSKPDGQNIRWVNQFPPSGSEKNPKLGQKVMDFIFGGSDNEALIKPVGVFATDSGNYWVLDQGNGTLFRVIEQMGDITHFRNKTNTVFTSLIGVCSLPDGNLLFTDSYLNKIFSYLPGEKQLNVFNDTLVLDRPTAIAYSPLNQQVWVVETNAHRITILDENGGLIKRIGKRGIAEGEFNFPTYIWVDKFGKVFIVDAMNFRIQVFTVNGDFISDFGKIGDATGYFARPKGLATDSDGNIYIADALFNAVQIFDPEGNFLFSFGRQGHGQGEFWMPAGIYIDEHDYIYVADTYNSRIQVFQYMKGGRK